jgi:hypothetical protein
MMHQSKGVAQGRAEAPKNSIRAELRGWSEMGFNKPPQIMV